MQGAIIKKFCFEKKKVKKILAYNDDEDSILYDSEVDEKSVVSMNDRCAKKSAKGSKKVNLKSNKEKLKYLSDLFPQHETIYIEDVLFTANWDIKVAKVKLEENLKRPYVKHSDENKHTIYDKNEEENINENVFDKRRCKKLKFFESDDDSDIEMGNSKRVLEFVDTSSNFTEDLSDIQNESVLKDKEEKLKYLIDIFPQYETIYIEDVLFTANWDIKVAKVKLEENLKMQYAKHLDKDKDTICNNYEEKNINKNASDKRRLKKFKFFESDDESDIEIIDNKNSKQVLKFVDASNHFTKGISYLEDKFIPQDEGEKLKYLIDLFPQYENMYIKNILFTTNWDTKVAKEILNEKHIKSLEKLKENYKCPSVKNKFSEENYHKICKNDEENANENVNVWNKRRFQRLNFFESDDDSDVEIINNISNNATKQVLDFKDNSNNFTKNLPDLERNSNLKAEEEKLKYLIDLFPQHENTNIKDILVTVNWDIEVAKEKLNENKKGTIEKTICSEENQHEICYHEEEENIDKNISHKRPLKKFKFFESDDDSNVQSDNYNTTNNDIKPVLESMDNTNNFTLLESDANSDVKIVPNFTNSDAKSEIDNVLSTKSSLHQCEKSANPNVDTNINEEKPINDISKKLLDLQPSSKSIYSNEIKCETCANKEENSDENDSDELQLKKYKVFRRSDDSDIEMIDDIHVDKKAVLEFMEYALPTELSLLQKCSQKKVNAIIEARPFKDWKNLIFKFQNIKVLSTELLIAAQDLIQTRNTIDSLMKKCLCLAEKVEKEVTDSSALLKEQPKGLSSKFTLSPYQMVGLNWLAVMHAQNVNGILADEMGLGKTVQVIAFLTYLKEAVHKEDDSTHLIIVPSSTMENWSNEFSRWSPGLRVVKYYGSQDERKEMRLGWRNGDLDGVDVILTTYSFISSNRKERKFFQTLPLKYVIFDEAHMLKNMCTLRYKSLAKINANRRLLLTGTPLQNNLLELMSLLIFVVPSIFARDINKIKNLFSINPKICADKSNEDKSLFEEEQIKNAKLVMRPFVLRRLKAEVLKDLPKKTSEVIICPMLEQQKEKYTNLVIQFSQQSANVSMMMSLRKLANHPLLLRHYYDEEKLTQISKKLINESGWSQKNIQYTYEELLQTSDFKICQLSRIYKSLAGFGLPQTLIPESGKLKKLDEILPDLKENNHRVLIFSQFTMILDILEEYLTIRGYRYLRLDGSTPVMQRQDLIDQFTEDNDIFVFLLSTRAGGLGINLTSADIVIIHDIDFNPYNDKQAEDRCHRVGQQRSVRIIRLLSEDTIEEAMYKLAQEKLNLEQRITSNKQNESTENNDALQLLKMIQDQNRKFLILSPTTNRESSEFEDEIDNRNSICKIED